MQLRLALRAAGEGSWFMLFGVVLVRFFGAFLRATDFATDSRPWGDECTTVLASSTGTKVLDQQAHGLVTDCRRAGSQGLPTRCVAVTHAPAASS